MATTVEELIARIKDKNDKVRAAAWQSAGNIGAAAVKPLAAVITDADVEVGRAAKRGLWAIVHHAGRPGADDEKKPVVAALAGLLDDGQPPAVRREALWMLSEIGGDESVDPIAAILKDKELREDARCALERIPGDKSLAALRAALDSVPAEFKLAVAQSLRTRGVAVDRQKYPCQKLVPRKQTQVEPLAADRGRTS